MSTRAPQPEHYSVELEPDDEQWWPGRCSCGADLGPFPTAEDAADGLMQHAYDAGYADALRTVVAMSPAGDANSQADPGGAE